MSERNGIDNLDLAAEGLQDSLSGAAQMGAQFQAELKRISQGLAATGKDAATLERGLSRGLRRAFDGLVFDGLKLSDALEGMARTMIDTAYSAAMRPVTNHFGGLISGGVANLMKGILPFADGGSFSQGRVMPFANGGVVSGPTMFPMRGGTGLMGEAGPEAIMPLARGPDGKLGVRGAGGRGTTVVMNIRTPDVEGFRRSQGQIAAQMNRALSHGARNR